MPLQKMSKGRKQPRVYNNNLIHLKSEKASIKTSYNCACKVDEL